jgi:pimeloyl-ACP methyl ester carboxylesterase
LRKGSQTLEANINRNSPHKNSWFDWVMNLIADKKREKWTVMPLVQTSRGVIHIDQQGQGEPLLLLHANPGDPRDFDAVLPALSEKFHVIRVSWPGYGKGPAPVPPASASAMLFAELLEQLVLKLDLRGVRIIGNSVGAYAAVRLALAQPGRVAALVLVAPAGFATPTRFTRLFCRCKGSERVTRWSNGLLAQHYLRLHTDATQAMLERARGEQRQETAIAVNAALWRSFLKPESDLREAAAHVQAPTLVIAGQHDPLVSLQDSRRAAATIPGAHLMVLPCGHAPFAEMPELFLSVAMDFLMGHLSQQPAQESTPVDPRLRGDDGE